MDYRDLNGNGRLDPYEDPSRPIEERVEDLLAQMTLEEKAGLMHHTPIGMNPDGTLLEEPAPFSPIATPELVHGRHITHFNIYWTPGAQEVAAWHNRLQKLAEEARLGIPVTISTDPRHGFSDNPATSMSSARSRSGRSRSASPPRPTRSSCGSSATWRGRSTWRSASASRCTRWPTSPPSRAGRGPRACFGEDAELAVPAARRVYPRLPGRRARAAQRRVHDEALPRRGPAGRRRGSALRHRQGSGLPGGQIRVPPAAVRGGVRGGDGADHAVLRPARRNGAARRSASGSTAT